MVEKDVEVNSSSLEAYSIEIKELKNTLQTLQIELQSHLSMVCATSNQETVSYLYRPLDVPYWLMSFI